MISAHALGFGVFTVLLNNKARPPWAADIIVASLACGPGSG